MDKPAISSTSSDAILLQACRNGNAGAWSHLLNRYERLVYSIPLNYGLAAEDAADIAQIVFTALLESLDALADDSNLGGWLATVTRRHTWRMLKRRRLQATDTLDSEALEIVAPKQSSQLERWEVVEWLNKGLIRLNERCQALITALYFEEDEPSYSEIAQRLRMAEGSIGPTRARCLQKLKELLTEQ